MFKQGTVVLTPFPFTDLSGDKVRPAVIISDSLRSEDVVVVFVTTKLKLRGVHVIHILPTDGNGLKVPSTIVTSKIATLHKKVILGELGKLDEKDKIAVLTSIKALFGF